MTAETSQELPVSKWLITHFFSFWLNAYNNIYSADSYATDESHWWHKSLYATSYKDRAVSKMLAKYIPFPIHNAHRIRAT